MNVMTSHSVVDRMAADLAERRRNTICRNRAYINLARAILASPRQSARRKPPPENRKSDPRCPV